MSGKLSFQQEFTEAWLHQGPYRVFGLKLDPFCLWHRFLLQAKKSPLAREDCKINVWQLYEAAKICSSRYGDLGSIRFTRVEFFWRTARKSLSTELKTFNRYLLDYHALPQLNPPDSYDRGKEVPKKPKGQMPRDLSVASRVMLLMDCSEEKAWTVDIGKAEHYAAAWSHLVGQAELDFKSERDIAWDKRMAELKRKMQRKARQEEEKNHGG